MGTSTSMPTANPSPPTPSTSSLIAAFDLYRTNRQLWLQIEADKKRVRDATHAKIMNFELGQTHSCFPHFRNMPFELRAMVWEFAALEARIVEMDIMRGIVEMDIVRGIVEMDIVRGDKCQLVSNTLVPGILHACMEAREAGLKMYTVLEYKHSVIQGWKTRDLGSKFGITYVNFNTDIVLIDRKTVMAPYPKDTDRIWNQLVQGALSVYGPKIKYLAVSIADIKAFTDGAYSFASMLEPLEKIYLIEKFADPRTSTGKPTSPTGNIMLTDVEEGHRDVRGGISMFQLMVKEFKCKLERVDRRWVTFDLNSAGGGVNPAGANANTAGVVMGASHLVVRNNPNPSPLPVVQGVQASRDCYRLMDAEDRRRREISERETHEKAVESGEKPQPKTIDQLDGAIFDEFGADITGYGSDVLEDDEGDFDDDDVDARFAAELQARLDMGEDIDDL